MKHRGMYLLFLLLLNSIIKANPVGAIFVPQKQFDDVEFMITSHLLDSAGISYYVFSEKDDTCFGRDGFNLIPFTVIDSVSNYPLDFLIINGGLGIFYYFDNAKLHKIVSRADSAKNLIVASAFAPVLLMKSGVLRGRKINFVRNKITQDFMQRYNINYKSEPIVISENLITSPSTEFVRLYLREFIRNYNETFNPKSE